MRNFTTLLSTLLCVLILSGCGSLNKRYEAKNDAHDEDEIVQIPVDPDQPNILPIDAEDAEKKEDVVSAPEVTDQSLEKSSQAEPARVDIPDAKVSLKIYPDIPHHYNRHVQKWLDYFQSKRGSVHMQKYLERSARYLPAMKKILKENGLPEDLVYIALIESGFGSSARSHAGAVGYWQFIAPTGRRYNLQINSLIDERKDPFKSTLAAVKYFRSLYNVFGNWYFAFAGYNGGENRMFRVLMKHDSRDFWTIAETKKMLPKETANYIPKYIAARMIAKNPEKYGFTNLEYHEPLSFSEVVASQTVNLRTMAQEMGIQYEDLRSLNPQFNTEFAPNLNNQSLVIRVPTNSTEKATVAMSKSYVANTRAIAMVRSNESYRYKVKHGDTLHRIAKKHGTTISRIRSMNNLGSKSALRVGQFLKVPEGQANQKQIIQDLRRTLKESRTAEKKPQSSKRIKKDKKQQIIVRRGDTLLNIARKYNVSLSRILAANDLSRRSKLLVGTKLVIPK
ncbi:MAG: LysM peptidoglycan-binding domain-containing protein [Bdellovibrionota bacterium]